MAKVTLTDLTTLANDTSAVNSLNTNFQTLEDYINNNVLSRNTGAETNTMQNDIDMNSYSLLNLNQINGVDFSEYSSAAASAAAALVSENNASTSETNAAVSAAAALVSENNAASSEAAAAASAASLNFNLDQTNTFTAAQVASTQINTNVSGSTTLDFDEYNNFILTLTGNITLANPTTENVGQAGFICLKQDGTGSRTVTLGSEYLTVGGAGLTVSTTASAIDLVGYVVVGSGQILLGDVLAEFS